MNELRGRGDGVMRRGGVVVAVWLLACVLCPGVLAGVVDERAAREGFAAGEARFAAGAALNAKDPKAASLAFSESASHWDGVRNLGVLNAGLETNIGNARLLAGDAPRALAAFKRALQLDPDRREALDGLADARRRLGTTAPPVLSLGESGGVVGRLVERASVTVGAAVSASMLLVLAGVAYVAGWGVVVYRFTRRAGAGVRVVWAVVVLWAVAAGLVVPFVVNARRVGFDAVVVRDVLARNGPSDSMYAATFETPLKAGAEVGVVVQRGEWCKVRVADGRESWLPTDALEAAGVGAWRGSEPP